MPAFSLFDIAFFGRGFRPFFLLGAFYAAFMVFAWVLIFNGNITAPEIWQDVVLWHAHEMIFGFTVAIISGFLLTAVANWIDCMPVSKGHLALLCLVWLLGRLGFWFAYAPQIVLAVIDLSFIPLVTVSLAIPIIKARNKANFVFLVFLTLLFLSNLYMHLFVAKIVGGDVYLIAYSSVLLIMAVISVAGGRVIPAFAAVGLRRHGIVVEQVGQYKTDMSAMFLILATAISVTTFGLESFISGFLALAAAIVHLWRMRFWHTKKSLIEPLLWVLHLGYLWLVIGLFVLALYSFGIVAERSLALHILTVGSIGTMVIGMLPRVTMGHTGHRLEACLKTIIAFYMMQFAVVIRVIALFVKGDSYSLLIMSSGLFWSGAFVIYLWVYSKLLISSRPDGMPA